jgi:hypothetical protein
MCSIVGVFDIKSDLQELRSQALEMSKLVRHRGRIGQAFFALIMQFWLTSDFLLLTHSRGNNPYLVKTRNIFLPLMAKYIITKNFVHKPKTFMNTKPILIAKLFWLYTRKKVLILSKI